MPRVSVILPVCRAEQYIEDCIQSILNQTFRDFELIIVTNGSDEQTLFKIDHFRNDRIRRIDFEKADLVKAVNTGIASSKGEFIARMDADDIMTLNRLGLQMKFLNEKPNFDVVSGKVLYEGDKNKNKGYYLHVEWLNQLKTHSDIYLNRFVDSPVANPSLMMRKKIFDQFGLFENGDFPEDYEMVLRWLDSGVRIGKVYEPVLHWRDHARRLTRNDNRYSQDAFYRIKARYFSTWFHRSKKAGDSVLIWGTGKSVWEKSRFLKDRGIEVLGYIDVKNNKSVFKEKPIFHYSSIPANQFILSYVSDREGRQEIYNYLLKNGFDPGEDFYMMS